MAVYHFSAKTVSRSAGRSSTAAAAYRAAERIVDERTGEIHDYTRKGGVVDSQVILPGGGTMARAELWNSVEAKHKRSDATVAREFVVALPAELEGDQRQDLARSYARELADRYGVAVDINVHAPGKDGDQRNHHAHILMSACYVSATGELGKKAVELDPIHCQRHGLANVVEVERERWEHLANAALERAGQVVRIDHRSLADQGIEDRLPGVHLGPTATAIERSGRESDVGRRARAQADQFMADMQAQVALQRAAEKDVAELEAELAQLRWQATPVQDRLKATREAHSRLLDERKSLWQREQQAEEAAKRARPMVEVKAAVEALPVAVKRAKAAKEQVAELRQEEGRLHWWNWLQRRRLAKELPAAAERAEALVAKAKGLEELAKSPVREKVQEVQGQLKSERHGFDGRFDASLDKIANLEGLHRAQESRQAELQRERERQRSIEAAGAAAERSRAYIERQQAKPKERERERTRGDDGPSLGM